MNRTADAIIADYATARAAYNRNNTESDLETMNRLKAAVAILWAGYAFDLDLAADHYLAELAA